jgi:hypothetical protein
MSLLDIIKDDVLIDSAPVLAPFLTNIVNAKGDPLKTMAAWAQFQGNLAQAGVTLEGDVITQLGGIIAGKFTSLIAQAQADLTKQTLALNPPAPPPSPPS